MKKSCIILLATLLVASNSFSQDSIGSVFYLNKLPPGGVILDKDWKFQHGDNATYASSDFDDSKWQNINPVLEIEKQPSTATTGICWLRIHILLDSALLYQHLSLIVSQATASEIYANGKLIYRFGKISNLPQEIVALDPKNKIVSFPVARNPRQLLAVRYVVMPDIKYTDAFLRTNSLLQIRINQIDAALKSDESRYWQNGYPTTLAFTIAAFLIFAILHLAFFIYSPSVKANLFFSLFAINVIAANLLQYNIPNEVRYIFPVSNLSYFFNSIQNIFLLTAVCLLLKQKRGWVYWGLVAISVLSSLVGIKNHHPNWDLTDISTLLVIAGIIRTAVIALKQKIRGAWIILTGGIFFAIFWIVWSLGFKIGYTFRPISLHYTYVDLFYVLRYLSISIATSIYLALDFAFTSHALQNKLTEVEKLSGEKQQILANQNEMLEKQVTDRTSALNNSLDELKRTQKQLVHQEKMASLGELTAGIAHEIQNPLNFVNNFSELNSELIDEAQLAIRSGKSEDAIELLEGLRNNQIKINQHGKRADSIVKGMLQHSKQTTGLKEPTDLNKMADEFLRLSFHGFRSHDNQFKAEIEKDFDKNMGEIEIVRQDIGRVLLNLYNNAFYAVNEKRKVLDGKYLPVVSVRTKRKDGGIEIRISDNGNGIPQKIFDKIFQPFFTTKPTGQGTGLGLSLSYDVVRAHGGEIKAESKDGEGSEFIIWLPVHANSSI